VDDDAHQSTYLTKQKIERKKKKRKECSYHFGGTSWNVSYFNCCWFELANMEEGRGVI
jgi:hypothetical protein